MHIDQSYIPYLKGDRFSNSLKFEVREQNEPLMARSQLITQLIKNKRVIHLGFLDHVDLLIKKISKGKWLHNDIREHAKKCLGIDINRDGVDYLKKNFSIEDVLSADIINEDIKKILETRWDYMIAGEVLEHIDNPCHFLSQIKRKYAGVIDKLIITVPNGFCSANFLAMKKQHECINSDHRYWFTPYTLSKIIILSQMKILRLSFCTATAVSKRRIFRRYYLKKYPGLREIIVAVVKINDHY